MTPEHGTREFRIARAKLKHGALLAAVLAVIGLWALSPFGPEFADAALIGVINLALAAGVAFHIWRSARDPSPRMMVGHEGIWFRDWGLPGVPWEQIADAYLDGARFYSFISIELRDFDGLLAGIDERERTKLRANRLVKPPRLIIPDSTLDAQLSEILDAIQCRRPAAATG